MDLNKLVTDLIDKEYDDNEQETSEMKTEVFAFASRSKAKAKPRRLSTTCSSSRTVPILERIWTDIEPGAQFDQAYPVAKRLNTLLRHGEIPREEDGAIELWRLKDYLRNNFENSQYWSDDVWKSKMVGRRRQRKQDSSTILIRQDKKFFTSELFKVSFMTQSHLSYTAGQCVNSEQFLRVHLSYWMCSQFTLHHKFRIDSGRTQF